MSRESASTYSRREYVTDDSAAPSSRFSPKGTTSVKLTVGVDLEVGVEAADADAVEGEGEGGVAPVEEMWVQRGV